MQKFWMESSGLGVAEFVSSIVSLGAIAVADDIAPGFIKNSTKFLAKNVVEPHLEPIEKIMDSLCRLEECKTDPNESREKRAEKLSRAIVLFSAAFVPSFIAKVAVRRGINEACSLGDKHPWWHVWRANKHDRGVVYWDEGFHIGSLLLLNTGAAKYTDELIRSSTSMLQKIGFSQQRAHELSSMAMIWELPNIIGVAGGIGKIAHTHLGKNATSHAERLAVRNSVSHLPEPNV